ncbi:MAG TPA: NAD(P)-dependent oxidoreductase [Vicinamibacterales bacterium]|nr:NAD(P)-dependent oxidoreductase [Vicinamibacterales bacterium]
MALTVGFIGLGIMGSRMAANLQTHGYNLVLYNRTRGKAEALLRGGAKWGNTPVGVAVEADVLFTMLANPETVEATALGTEGFLRAMRPGSIWVNSSTVNPSFARRMAEEARANGVRYLDAPVTGSKEAAAGARLLFMVGGDATDLEVCRPLLSSMSTRIVHVGEHGLGSALKMVNNLLGAVSMAAFAEGAALGQALGVPRQTIFDTLLGGPMVAPVVGAKRTRIERDDYEADFSMRWMQKDLHLASVSGYEVGVPMPVVNVTKELYRLAMREGYADQDYGAIYAYLTADHNGPSASAPEARPAPARDVAVP